VEVFSVGLGSSSMTDLFPVTMLAVALGILLLDAAGFIFHALKGSQY